MKRPFSDRRRGWFPAFSPSNSKLTKRRIAEGQYYEAHQQLRVIASRYTKASDWASATDILFRGAQSLLQAGQGGSGGDLCIFLLDVFNKSETKPDANSKGKLITLLRAFPANEPTKKKFVAEMIAWSAKYGEYPAGDPEIHHVAGSAFAEGMSRYRSWQLVVLTNALQSSNPTMPNDTSSLAQKTLQKPSPTSNIRGTTLMTRTLHLSMLLVVLFPTYLPATCAPRTSSSCSSHRVYPASPAFKRSKCPPQLQIYAFTLHYLCSTSWGCCY